MKILVVENEVYLAQSIVTKLTEIGHNCEMCTSAREAAKDTNFDIVLLSTSLNSHDLTPIIEIFKNSIVILMVSYISNDTVSKPLSAGAKDYIVKPFMIEELVRKIDHHQDYEKLKKLNKVYEDYLDFTFKEIKNDYDYKNMELPLYLYTSVQKNADAFVYNYAKENKKIFEFIDISRQDGFSKLKNLSSETYVYIVNYQTLKKNEKKEFCELIKDKKAIISTLENIEEAQINILEINSENNIFSQNDILPIEDYVKYIVLNYQHKYPDTELSKKLGISRKSLWEKRKKYDIIKKK